MVEKQAIRTGDSVSVPVRVDVLEAPSPDWKDMVAGASDATFCHWQEWHGVLGDVTGARCFWLEARDDAGKLVGGMPLARVRSRILGDYLVSMPFLNYGGPLGESGVQGRLVQEAVALAGKLGVGSLELRARHRVSTEVPIAQRRITVVLPLPATADTLWEGFRSKLRSQVRRPQKEGMETRFGEDQVLPFYEVFARNMRDLGTPSLPLRWFERIRHDFGSAVRFGVVYAGTQPVAAGCGFQSPGEFEMTWASSLKEWAARAPNMLLYWSFMQEAIATGARAFNFGRCVEGGGTHRFKRQWGGQDVPLPWIRWPAAAQAAPPGADDARFALATATWKRLPLGITTRLGPWLARKIP